MSEHDDIKDLQRQLVDLQSQLAFQEHTLAQLNDSLTLQQRDLGTVKNMLELLKQQYLALNEQLPGDNPDNDKPPHY